MVLEFLTFKTVAVAVVVCVFVKLVHRVLVVTNFSRQIIAMCTCEYGFK